MSSTNQAFYGLMERGVTALEKLASLMEISMHGQDQVKEAFDKIFEEVAGPLGPPEQSQNLESEYVGPVEPPTVVGWFVDIAAKDRPIMVKLSDGTVRKPTPEEASKLE